MPPRRRLARELLEAEGFDADDARAMAEACARVLSRVHEVLRPLVGPGGYEVVLGRAAVLATRAHPELAEVPIPTSGPPPREELVPVFEETPAPEEAALSLVAEFLHFLARLLGWRLTLVILRDPWPDVVTGHSPDDLSSDPSRPATEHS